MSDSNQAKKICARCIYFFRVGDDIGECRSKAPVLIAHPNARSVDTMFPMVRGTCFCGEGEWLLINEDGSCTRHFFNDFEFEVETDEEVYEEEVVDE